MKKVLILCSFLVTGYLAQAQIGSMLDKAKTVATAAGFDVNKLTGSITNQLASKLSLTKIQLPKVSSAVSTFLAAKSQILPLLKTNKAAYQAKQTGLFNNLKSSLTGILVKDQMNKFLGLKPATNDPTNVLSNLFY